MELFPFMTCLPLLNMSTFSLTMHTNLFFLWGNSPMLVTPSKGTIQQ